MHACASQIIKHFSTKMSPGEHSADSLNSNPAKLCFVVKQSVREAAVGGYLNILCENFYNHIGYYLLDRTQSCFPLLVF
jgi:hypothetical protein